jgi:hypothetical protein
MAPELIETANGRTFDALGMGNVRLNLLNKDGVTTVVLHNAIYMPDVAFMLISVPWLDRARYNTLFGNGKAKIIALD